MARSKTFTNNFEEIAPVAAMGAIALSTLIPFLGGVVPKPAAVAMIAVITATKINTISKYVPAEANKNLCMKSEVLNLGFDILVAGTVYLLGSTTLTTVGVLSAMPAAAALISYCGFKLLYNGTNNPLDHIKAYVSERDDVIKAGSRERPDFWSALKTNSTESAATLFYSLFGAGTQTRIPLMSSYSLPVLDAGWAVLSIFGISSAGYRAHARHTADIWVAGKEIIKNLTTVASGAILACFSGVYIAPIILGGVIARMTSGGDHSYAEQLFGSVIQGEQPGAAAVLH